jgi:hypothetical protein
VASVRRLRDQAEAPPVGSIETKILPPTAPATHRAVPEQETARRSGAPGSWAVCHCPSLGSVEVTIRPAAALDPSAVVVAVIHEDNRPSARVATALGLVLDGMTTEGGGERLRFARRVGC